MRKKLFTLAVLLVLLFPVAALFNSCRKPCSDAHCHYVTNISLAVVDNADSLPHNPVNAQVYAKALLLQLTLEDSLARDTFGTCHRNTNPFLPGATAMYYRNCKQDAYVDHLVSFSITGNKDFDASHPAGTDLQSFFYCPDKSFMNAGTYNMYLMNTPATSDTYIFTVTLNYSSGKVLQRTTSPVKLLL